MECITHQLLFEIMVASVCIYTGAVCPVTWISARSCLASLIVFNISSGSPRVEEILETKFFEEKSTNCKRGD